MFSAARFSVQLYFSLFVESSPSHLLIVGFPVSLVPAEAQRCSPNRLGTQEHTSNSAIFPSSLLLIRSSFCQIADSIQIYFWCELEEGTHSRAAHTAAVLD
jgi:hypothetical protein